MLVVRGGGLKEGHTAHSLSLSSRYQLALCLFQRCTACVSGEGGGVKEGHAAHIFPHLFFLIPPASFVLVPTLHSLSGGEGEGGRWNNKSLTEHVSIPDLKPAVWRAQAL